MQSHIRIRLDSSSGSVPEEAFVSLRRIRAIRENEIRILIHGFNCNENEALSSYNNLMSSLEKFTFERESISERFLCLTWVGDLSRGKLASSVLYAQAIEAAQVCARIAAKEIDDIVATVRSNCQDVRKITFIAHSLGCRLVLFLLDQLVERARRENPDAALTRVTYDAVFLGAAIPEGDIKRDSPLRGAVEAVERRANFWSSTDDILRFAFPAGEQSYRSFLGGSSRGGRALGTFSGNDDLTWDEVGLTDTGIGHSDYWTDEYVAQELVRFFGFVPSRIPPERTLPLRRNLDAERMLERYELGVFT